MISTIIVQHFQPNVFRFYCGFDLSHIIPVEEDGYSINYCYDHVLQDLFRLADSGYCKLPLEVHMPKSYKPTLITSVEDPEWGQICCYRQDYPKQLSLLRHEFGSLRNGLRPYLICKADKDGMTLFPHRKLNLGHAKLTTYLHNYNTLELKSA